jgi:hypothetical protein
MGQSGKITVIKTQPMRSRTSALPVAGGRSPSGHGFGRGWPAATWVSVVSRAVAAAVGWRAYDPLVIALATIVAGAAASRLLGRSDPAWVRPQG